MKMLALLRGINVGGNRKVPMKELRSIAVCAGFTEVDTYINSGNLIFSTKKKKEKVSSILEERIAESFGFHVDVIVCTSSEWKKFVVKAPFEEAQEARPNLLMLGLPKGPCPRTAARMISEKASKNEQVKVAKGAIWIDFENGVGGSKLTPKWIDKSVGSPVTLRNWRTVLKLNEMLSDE